MPLPSGRLARVLAAGATALLASGGAGATGGPAAASTPAAATSSATSSPFCAPALPGHRTCFGLALKASARRQTQARAAVRPQVESAQGGYAPQDIQAAYGLGSVVSTNGTGQTVAVVDAYNDPNAASDLAAYRAYFGLPACPVGTGASSCFRKVDQGGGQTFPPPDPGWSQEITLDLDAVSTACPLCHILLVEARTNQDPDLIAAIQEASGLRASVMSLSFGSCEAGVGPGGFDNVLQQANVPISVASGDTGYFYSSQVGADNPMGCTTGTPEYPASSPYVTAVGGTTLSPSGNTRGWAESAWSYSANGSGGSGCSGFEPKPAWQTAGGCTKRTVADISADADPQTGLSVYETYPNIGWSFYGGTSLAAPLVAGIYALANSPAAAVDGQVWYTTAQVNDVTSGSTAPVPSDCSPTYLCNAGPGFDGPTGMGTPNGPPILPLAMTQLTSPWNSTAIPLGWSPPPNIQPSSYRVWEQDDTGGAGPWLPWVSTASTTATFYGFRNHRYGFAVQYFMANGWSSGAPSLPATTTMISAGATRPTPFTSMYAVDGYGVLHPGSSPPLVGATWPGWNIVRGIVSSTSGQGGLALDGFGGLHQFGDSPAAQITGYWPGWDIASGVTTLPGGSSGYVLDGWGGLHPFALSGVTMPPAATGNSYWGGWSIARGVATFADGSGGVVLDGWGGVHPFSAGAGGPRPAQPSSGAPWPGWDIARSIVLLPGSSASSYRGFVLDGWGDLHAFASIGTALPVAPRNGPYWLGWDIARSIVMMPGSTTDGYVVDGYGGFHPFGSAPAVITSNYGADGALVRGAAAG